MSYTFEVSPAPTNANRKRGVHWSVPKKERDRIEQEIGVQVIKAGRPKLKRARVFLKRTGWNEMDESGVIESAKPGIDALVSHGVLPDDKPKYVTYAGVDQEIDRKRPPVARLFVTLEEIETP